MLETYGPMARPDLAMMLEGDAVLRRQMNRDDEAEAAARRARSIRVELAKAQPTK